MAEKKQLTFSMGQKKYMYKGYEERKEQDFFEMFAKMWKGPEGGEATPEDVEATWKQNFPDSEKDPADLHAMYLKELRKQEERKLRRSKREEEKKAEEQQAEAEASQQRESGGSGGARAPPAAATPPAGEPPKSARREKEFTAQEKEELHDFINEVLRDDEGPGTHRVPDTSRSPSEPQTARLAGMHQVKLQMEGGDKRCKVVTVGRDTKFEDLIQQVNKKFDQELVLTFEDCYGDRVEVDDDDTLLLFIDEFEAQDAQRRPKMLCSLPQTRRKVTEDALTGGDHGGPVSKDRALPSFHVDPSGKSQKVWVKEKLTLTGHSLAIYSCAIGPMGKHILSASRDRSLRLWDAKTGQCKQKFNGHNGFVLSCDITANEQNIVSSSDDNQVKVWSTATGKKVLTMKGPQGEKGHVDKVYSVQYSPSNKHIVSGSCDHTVRVWTSEGRQHSVLRSHTHAVFSCQFSNDGKLVVSGADDKTLKLWDWERSQEPVMTLSGHTGTVWSVSVAKGDNLLASSSMDHEVRLWDVRKGQHIAVLGGHGTPVQHVIFTKCGKYAISCARDWSIKFWDVEAAIRGESAAVNNVQGHKNTVYHLACTNDTLISSSLDETVKVWDLHTS